MIKRKQGENEALEILENIGIEMDEEGFTEMMVRFIPGRVMAVNWFHRDRPNTLAVS